MNIFSRIEAKKGEFSKGQRAIAQYLTEHIEYAAYITARRLGEITGVSESTVVRFAAELGYAGYPEMQQSMQEAVRYRLNSVQRMQAGDSRIGDKDIMRKVMQSDIEKIRITMERTLTQDFEASVNTIAEARRIYILGVRSAASLADFLGFYFGMMFDNVKVVQTASISDVFEQILRIGEGDLLIGLSFPRYSRRTLQAVQYAIERGADTIAITDTAEAPIARISRHKLLAASDIASFVDSLVAPLSLINALIVAVGMRKREEITRTFTQLEKIWEDVQVYEPADRN